MIGVSPSALSEPLPLDCERLTCVSHFSLPDPFPYVGQNSSSQLELSIPFPGSIGSVNTLEDSTLVLVFPGKAFFRTQCSDYFKLAPSLPHSAGRLRDFSWYFLQDLGETPGGVLHTSTMSPFVGPLEFLLSDFFPQSLQQFSVMALVSSKHRFPWWFHPEASTSSVHHRPPQSQGWQFAFIDRCKSRSHFPFSIYTHLSYLINTRTVFHFSTFFGF